MKVDVRVTMLRWTTSIFSTFKGTRPLVPLARTVGFRVILSMERPMLKACASASTKYTGVDCSVDGRYQHDSVAAQDSSLCMMGITSSQVIVACGVWLYWQRASQQVSQGPSFDLGVDCRAISSLDALHKPWPKKTRETGPSTPAMAIILFC
jgi:hypothetical protein